MAIITTGSIQLTSQYNKSNDADAPLSTPVDNASPTLNLGLTNGNGANQIQVVHRDRVTIAALATHSILLSNIIGSLCETIDLTKMMAFTVINQSIEPIGVGGNAANFDFLSVQTTEYNLEASDGVTPTFMTWQSNAGVAIVGATNDRFDVTNNGGADAVVEIILYGQGTNS
jgi:hypothetical protein